MNFFSLQDLDFIFPFVVFFYGALVTLVLHIPKLNELSETRFSDSLHRQIMGHRYLALLSLVLGAIWSLQNLWFY